MAKDFLEDIVRPDTPSIIDHEQIHVYMPKASANKRGAAMFDGNDFGIDTKGRVFNYSSQKNLEKAADPIFDPDILISTGGNKVSLIKTLDTEFEHVEVGEYGFDSRAPKGTIRLNRKLLSNYTQGQINTSQPGLSLFNIGNTDVELDDFKQQVNVNDHLVTSIAWADEPLGDERKLGFKFDPKYFEVNTDGVQYRSGYAQRSWGSLDASSDRDKFGLVKMDYRADMLGDDGRPYAATYSPGNWLDIDTNNNLAFNEQRLRDLIQFKVDYTFIRPNYGMTTGSEYLEKWLQKDEIQSPIKPLPFQVSGLTDEDGASANYMASPTPSASPQLAIRKHYFSQATNIDITYNAGERVPEFWFTIPGHTTPDGNMAPDASSPSGYVFTVTCTYNNIPFAQFSEVPDYIWDNYYDENKMISRTELLINKIGVGLSKVENLNPFEYPVSAAQKSRLLLDIDWMDSVTPPAPGTSQSMFNIDVGKTADYLLHSRTGNVKNRIGQMFKEIDDINDTLNTVTKNYLGLINIDNGATLTEQEIKDYLNENFPPDTSGYSEKTHIYVINSSSYWYIEVDPVNGNKWFDSGLEIQSFEMRQANYANMNKTPDVVLRYSGESKFGDEISADAYYWASINHVHPHAPDAFLWGTISDATDYYNPTITPKRLLVNSVDIDTNNPDRVMEFSNSIMDLKINIPYIREGQYQHNWSSYAAHPYDVSVTNPGTPIGSITAFTPGSTTNGRLMKTWVGTKQQFAAEFGGAGAPDDVHWFITDDVTQYEGEIIESYTLTNDYLLPFRQEIMRGTGASYLFPMDPSNPLYASDGTTYIYAPIGGRITWQEFKPTDYLPIVFDKTYNIDPDTFDFKFNNRPFVVGDASNATDAITELEFFKTRRSTDGATETRLGFSTSPYMTYADMTSNVSSTIAVPKMRQWIDTSGVYPVVSRTQNTSASTLTTQINNDTVSSSISKVWTLISEMFDDMHSTSNRTALTGAASTDPHYATRRSIFSELTAIRAQLNRYPSFGTTVITEPTAATLTINTDYIMRSSADGGNVTMKTFATAMTDAFGAISGKAANLVLKVNSTNNGYIWAPDVNTWTALVGATTSTNGTAGYAPQPLVANRLQYLRGDGTWATPTDTTFTLGANGSTTTETTVVTSGNYTRTFASLCLNYLQNLGTV